MMAAMCRLTEMGYMARSGAPPLDHLGSSCAPVAVAHHLCALIGADYMPEGSPHCASIAEAGRSASTAGSLKSVRLAPARASPTLGAPG